MGALTDYVTLTITRASVGLTRAGFGTALILTPNALWTTERTRTYADMSAVVVDFPVTSSPEYLAASAAFAQNPAPTKLKFGRLALKPTMVQTLDVVTVSNTHVYQVKVKGCSAAGVGVTPTTVSFTSDSTATDGEICVGLVTALNAVVNKCYTAVGVVSPITLTATAAGDWFSLEVVDVTDLKVKTTHVDPGVATDLNAIKNVDSDFYVVYNLFNSGPMATAIAGWVQTAKKTFICDTNTTESIITAVTNGDLLDGLKTLAYTRTLGFYHQAPNQFAGAALMGRCLPILPGGETWALKSLEGIAATPLTGTHKTNLQARNANGIESIGNVAVTFDGKVSSGEYYDVTRFMDWFENTAATRIFNALIAEDKTAFNDEGIAKIGAELRGALKEGVAAGGFNSDWTVTLPKLSDIPTADKTARTLNGVKFKATLAGAIHKVNVVGNVTA